MTKSLEGTVEAVAHRPILANLQTCHSHRIPDSNDYLVAHQKKKKDKLGHERLDNLLSEAAPINLTLSGHKMWTQGKFTETADFSFLRLGLVRGQVAPGFSRDSK